MANYRIVKATEAVDTDEYGWVVPYRIQIRAWALWPVLKKWVWLTGPKVSVCLNGEYSKIEEYKVQPVEFLDVEDARDFVHKLKRLSNANAKLPIWETVDEFNLK